MNHRGTITPEEEASSLAEDARALLEATSEVADQKVTEARKRLGEALQRGQAAYARLQAQIVNGAKAADKVVHDHPYPTMAVAFGLGALVGFLISRRN